MKKSLFFLAVIISVFIFSACESHVSEFEGNKNVKNSNIQPSNETKVYNDNNMEEEVEEITEYITHENNPLLKLACEGKVDGIDFGIGSYSGEIVEKWGMPDRCDNYMGGAYLAYDDKDVTFLTNTPMYDGKMEYADVVWIVIWGDSREIYNVRIGMTFEEIEEVLGRPSSKETPYENEESELYGGKWTITYDTGKYLLEFVADEENGPVDVAYLFKK